MCHSTLCIEFFDLQTDLCGDNSLQRMCLLVLGLSEFKSYLLVTFSPLYFDHNIVTNPLFIFLYCDLTHLLTCIRKIKVKLKFRIIAANILESNTSR